MGHKGPRTQLRGSGSHTAYIISGRNTQVTKLQCFSQRVTAISRLSLELCLTQEISYSLTQKILTNLIMRAPSMPALVVIFLLDGTKALNKEKEKPSCTLGFIKLHIAVMVSL